jgi:hypothetical protein
MTTNRERLEAAKAILGDAHDRLINLHPTIALSEAGVQAWWETRDGSDLILNFVTNMIWRFPTR